MGDYADGSPYGGHQAHRLIVQADEQKRCPYCSSDNEAIRATYFDQTCEGCILRMGVDVSRDPESR